MECRYAFPTICRYLNVCTRTRNVAKPASNGCGRQAENAASSSASSSFVLVVDSDAISRTRTAPLKTRTRTIEFQNQTKSGPWPRSDIIAVLWNYTASRRYESAELIGHHGARHSHRRRA